MKVFNLTDVPTRQLRYQGLAECPIKDLYGVIIPPGEHRVVRDTPANRKHLQQQYVGRDALSMDRVPNGYTGTAKEKGPPTVTEPAMLPSPPPPSPTESHPETPPPDTQPAPESDEGAESEDKSKRRKRSSRRGS